MGAARDWLYRNTRAPASVVSWCGSAGATEAMTAVRLPGSMALSCAVAHHKTDCLLAKTEAGAPRVVSEEPMFVSSQAHWTCAG